MYLLLLIINYYPLSNIGYESIERKLFTKIRFNEEIHNIFINIDIKKEDANEYFPINRDLNKYFLIA